MQEGKLIFVKNIFAAMFAAFFLFSANAFAAGSDFIASENNAAQMRLVGSYYNDENQNSKLIIGAHFKINSGWKIYGMDQSGFGQPPSFDFKNSKNINQNFKPNIHWPKSKQMQEKIGNQTISYNVYQDEVVIPLEIEVLDNSQEVNLEADFMYGLCKDICIPVFGKISLKIPPQSQDLPILNLIQYYWPEKILIHDKDVMVKNLEEKTAQPASSKITLINALIIAFIGGLILNIMPCVLPVLSIKLLSIINKSNARISRIKEAYIATTLGIIFSFLVLASATVLLKWLGKSLGWGLQFQNPYFLIFLIIILMIFTANLLGIFEVSFNSFLSAILDKKISESEKKRNIFIPNFLSGILAVLLATPCSAPFLGTAISFALSQDEIRIFLTFTVMGIGLAFPYIVLFAFPHAARLFPRPGSWMIKVKQIMAGFLAATAIWLIYVLTDNIGMLSSAIIAVLATLILAFFKIDSKFNLKIWQKILILFTLITLMFALPSQIMNYSKIKQRQYDQLWVKFDAKKIPELLSEGKIVVVDITADWCLTCKVNKFVVLSSKEVIAKLKNPNIVAMRGDLTVMDDEILNFMRLHNRYAIPFNIVYGPSAPDGILTSELLNKQKFIEIINQASPQLKP